MIRKCYDAANGETMTILKANEFSRDINWMDKAIKSAEQKPKNNGGTTDYYQLNPNWKQVQDIIEARNMNFAQGNILKAAFCFNNERHSGTNYERELNKIVWFCNRELQRIKKN